MSNKMAWLALGAVLAAWNVAAEWTNTDKVWENIDQVNKTMELDDVKYWTKWRLAELLGQCDINGNWQIDNRTSVRNWESTRANARNESKCKGKVVTAQLEEGLKQSQEGLKQSQEEGQRLDEERRNLIKQIKNSVN